MRLFVSLFLVCLVAGTLLGPSSATPSVLGVDAPASPPFSVGAATCASSGCHNAGGPRGSAGSEYTTWSSYDPHVHAAEVLNSDRSRRMVSLFRKSELDKSKPMEDVLCLSCHATDTKPTEPLTKKTPADFLTADGVGCESCHGPASQWKSTHYRPEWRALDDSAKSAAGLKSLKDLPDRVQLCAGCHVGDETKEVNHDLIAAGHPRLAFDFAAYHQIYPKHWSSEKLYPHDFDAWSWIVGQPATAQSALALLHSRAERSASAIDADKAACWPEFAEGSCFACHHNLTADDKAGNWRQRRGIGSDTIPWGRWYLPGSEFLLKHGGIAGLPAADAKMFEAVQLAMKSPIPDPKMTGAAANEARRKLAEWVNRLNSSAKAGQRFTPEALRDLSATAVQHGLAPNSIREWDDAVQNYLTLAALAYARTDLTEMKRDRLLALRKVLAFPADPERRTQWDSPRDFRPGDYIAALKQLGAQ